ncbi:MAG: exodeoxyribonuclease VII small subunit [Bacteroidales bacterium]|jgi:exodeoxyribonuclease VII small subunit|nr:exodeoxyribonuclease VII small subunit [Bacteroidales bacterium]
MNKTHKTSYTEAYEELQQIVSELEQGEISIDLLSEKVKRASELIAICKQKLYATELDVKQVLKTLSEENGGEEEVEG